MTERSRAERRHRQRTPFGLLNPFSSSTPFHLNEKLGCTHAREARVGAEQLGCALFARAPRFTALQSLCVLITHKTHRLAFVETLLKFRYRRLGRVNPRMGAEFRLRPGLWAACRRRAGRAGQLCHVSSYERLRAFACSYERLRAGSSAPGRVSRRVWSRLVAFSRAIFFSWTRSGTFGRVLSSFLVISRHSSSFFVPKWFFRVWRATGGCGTGWAGRAAVCCAWLPRAGGRMGKMAWHSFEIGMQLRHGRGCAGSSCAQVYYKSGAFAVAGNSRGHLGMGERF